VLQRKCHRTRRRRKFEYGWMVGEYHLMCKSSVYKHIFTSDGLVCVNCFRLLSLKVGKPKRVTWNGKRRSLCSGSTSLRQPPNKTCLNWKQKVHGQERCTFGFIEPHVLLGVIRHSDCRSILCVCVCVCVCVCEWVSDPRPWADVGLDHGLEHGVTDTRVLTLLSAVTTTEQEPSSMLC